RRPRPRSTNHLDRFNRQRPAASTVVATTQPPEESTMNFPIKATLHKLVVQHPGLTACGYTTLMQHPSHYGSTSVLRQLHREVDKGHFKRRKQSGQRPTVKAWRFYPV